MLQASLQHIVRAIVDNPDDATVAARNGGKGDLLEVRVHPDDLGRVIGKGGRMLRTIGQGARATARCGPAAGAVAQFQTGQQR